MKSFIITIISLLFSLSCLSQQEIKLCDDVQSTYTYLTNSSVAGQYDWSINGNFYTSTNNGNLTIDWSGFGIGQYQINVDVTSVAGCTSLPVTYDVTLLECDQTTMFAPNAFTPDGTNVNEIWVPMGYNYKSVEFMIFDRWGELIFESNDLNYGWDGNHKSIPCKSGIYVYKLFWIDSNNKRHYKYGHIALLR